MMNDLFSADPLGGEDPPFHLISTDHPYMATLGLSTFTTGTLYRWWNQKDGEGKYENHKYFAEDPISIADKTVPKLVLLGEYDTGFTDKTSEIGKNQFSFQAWRNEAEDVEGRKSGQYRIKYIDGGHTDLWDFVQAGVNAAKKPRHYTHGDLDAAEYGNLFLEEDGTLYYEFEMPDGKGGKEMVPFESISPITDCITINDYVRDQELNTLFRDGWDSKQFARNEFILDIQASKEGYVEWSGLVPFYLSLASGDAGVGDTFKCSKPEWVKYRLYLHPNSAPQSTRRGIAMATPTFVGPPVDSLGRKYQKKEDGAFSAFPVGSQAAEVVAELDMTYNEYTGKWEAGSKQMIGVVTQRLPKAQILTTLDLRELKPEEMLALPNDPSSHIIWGSGSAMPLSQQNANPMQWTPNYAEPSQLNEEGKFEPICPEEPSETKVEFRVFNASTKALESDQMVLLNQIDGQWFAIDFPSGLDQFTVITPGFEGKWEFSYCATNVVHHFRDENFDKIDADDIVQGFHKKYYAGDPLNKDKYSTAKDITKRIDGGYHQFTSFDMMDQHIAGTRKDGDGNAYAATNPLIAPNGDEIGGDRDGTHTGAFFGCIFPEGYDSEQIADYRIARNWDVLPTVAKSGIDGEPLYSENPETFGASATTTFKYFNEDGIARDAAVGPFDADSETLKRNDCSYEHVKDADGNFISMFPTDDDTALTNLPADIATNASPSGEHGQPIPNLHMIEQMYRNADPKVGVKDFFLLGKNWLRRKYDAGTAGSPVHMESSAFDFYPKKRNHIIFRPLKAEVYAQFSQTLDTPYTGPGAGGNKLSERGLARKNFGGEVCTQMTSKKKPCSQIAYKREQLWDEQGPSMNFKAFEDYNIAGIIYSIHNTFWGLQFNIDIPSKNSRHGGHHTDLGGSGIYEISPGAYLPDSDRFRWDAWGWEKNGWCHGGGGIAPSIQPPWESSAVEPAGAVGIIGAVCTCTAKDNINCITNNRLGVWSWGAYGGVGVFTQMPAWGKGNSYDDFQTTVLAVKVYHAWPREDTIYDPRYFAVHHFNAGILGFDDNDNPIKNTVIEKITQIDPTTFGTLTPAPKEYNYQIDQRTYEIDLRVPSAKALTPVDGVTNDPYELEVFDEVWGNAAKRSAVATPTWHETLPYRQWSIDTKRRGKLLPYKYKKKTIAMKEFHTSLPAYTVDADGKEHIYASGGCLVLGSLVVGLDPSPAPAIQFWDSADGSFKKFWPADGDNLACVVRNPGSGYAVNDTFSFPDTIATGVLMKVSGVDGDGRINILVVEDQGSAFINRSFVGSGTPITKSSSAGSYFTPLSTEKGAGFKAFLTAGTIKEVIEKDLKPSGALSTDWERVSSKSISQGSQDSGGPFGLETEDKEVNLAIANPSVDGKYDCFFRFHNDISHTFLTADHKGSTSRWCNDEQYVDLTITTN
jgi:hypothetical protein